MKSKKALVWRNLIKLIAGIVFFIIVMVFIFSSVADAEYENSIIACQRFFSSIEGKPVFFGEAKNEVTDKLKNSVANVCHSKSVEISRNEVEQVADLVKDCWAKTAKGEDILPDIATDMGVCIYCGSVVAKEDIPDYKERFDKIIVKEKYENLFSNEVEVINLNDATVKNSVPVSFNADTELQVFYYAKKPPVVSEVEDFSSFFQEYIGTPLHGFTGRYTYWGNVINHVALEGVLVGNSADTYAGVVVSSNKIYEEGEFEDIENKIFDLPCEVIIPVKNLK